MARTRLFSVVRQALASTGIATRRGPTALSRRQALLLGGAAALAGCAPLGGSVSRGPDIAILGGGAAGLTTAYRLGRAGVPATLYEGSARFGGRMYTRRDFNAEGMFCELGAELVDTPHVQLANLAAELGIALQRLEPEGSHRQEMFFFGGRLRTEREMLHEGKGAFVPVARRIAADQKMLTDAAGDWTARARAIDGMSLAAYLRQFRGRAAAWVLDLIDVAYHGELGLPTDQLSALVLVDGIGTDVDAELSLFGDSDEAFRISGGSSTLTDALAARLGDGIRRLPSHVLTSMRFDGGRFRLGFTTPAGRVEAAHDLVVMTMPFTKLREVEGLETLGLDPAKLRAIRELGYGDNAKVMVGTTSRPWDGPAAGLPVPSNGIFYAQDFQVVWDTSRGQPGTRGILTNFLAGVDDQAAAMATMQRGLRAVSPAIAGSLDTSNVASFFWARYPFAKGSYHAPRVGQVTTLMEVAPVPELDGRLLFAGEHTSTEFPGFMCGAIESGERAAAAILAGRRAMAA